MKVITDGGTEQLINLLANDTRIQLPTFRHEVMPSSQSHQVGQTPTIGPITVMKVVQQHNNTNSQ